MTNTSIVAKGTHPGSALYIERNVENAARTTTSRWYAGLIEVTGELAANDVE